MDRLQSQRRDLCAWLSEDPDYILAQCGDLLTVNEYKAVLESPDAHLKVGALLDVVVKKGRSTCESFTDVLRQHQAHYRHLWRFFDLNLQGLWQPAVFASQGSVVSANELTDVRGESFSNKVQIVRAPFSGLADGLLPRAGLVASGSSVILADRITGNTFNGDVTFSVCVQSAQMRGGTIEDVRPVPQAPAVRVEPSWKYVPTRRLAPTVRVAPSVKAVPVYDAIDYAVMSDPLLWPTDAPLLQ